MSDEITSIPNTLLEKFDRFQASIEEDIEAAESNADSKAEAEGWADAAARKTAELNNLDLTHQVKWRNRLTKKFLRLTRKWLVFLGCIVLLEGIHAPWVSRYVSFHLNNNVMIALLTSTTITVLGLFLVATRHVFHKNDKN
jgi:hypothetical protein